MVLCRSAHLGSDSICTQLFAGPRHNMLSAAQHGHRSMLDLQQQMQQQIPHVKPCMQVNPPPSNFAVNASAISASLTTATSSGDPAAVMSAVRTLAASTAAAAPPPTVVAGVTTIAAVDVHPRRHPLS